MLEFGTYDIASRRPWSYFLAGRRCRKICSTNTKSNQSKPPKPLIHKESSGGEIGRRARLRIWFRKECGFESHPEHFPSLFDFDRRRNRFWNSKPSPHCCLFLQLEITNTAGMPMPAGLPKGSRKYPRKGEIFIAQKSSFFLSNGAGIFIV